MKSLFLILMVLIPILGFSEASKFVILILSYNNQKWVEQNLESALSQDYENFRVIYVNDASSDQTLEIANKFIEVDIMKWVKQLDPNNDTEENKSASSSSDDHESAATNDKLAEFNTKFDA